jgi:hypothetical protein
MPKDRATQFGRFESLALVVGALLGSVLVTILDGGTRR